MSDLPADPAFDRLAEAFRAMGSVLVCYSGGVDSAFVLAVAHRVLGDRAVGMTAVSPSLAEAELEDAAHFARAIGARHELVASSEIDDERYAKNATDRCFHCKSELYRLSAAKKDEWRLGAVVNGTNKDDLGDYRPGLEAARDAGVKSPLVDCDLGKTDIRRLAKLLDLPVWDKPAAACLASRLPYGTRVTRERLAQIAALEAALKGLGLRQVRVRWHGLSSAEGTRAEASLARVEVDKSELEQAFLLRDAIVTAGKSAGFAYVTLDLAGYRTGSTNEVLSGKSLRIVS